MPTHTHSYTSPLHLLTATPLSLTHPHSYTYEFAPVYTLMEEEVLATMRRLVGWSTGDGLFVPGASIANLYGLLVARYHRFPEVREKGTRHLPQMVIFTSSQVSVLRAGESRLGDGGGGD